MGSSPTWLSPELANPKKAGITDVEHADERTTIQKTCDWRKAWIQTPDCQEGTSPAYERTVRTSDMKPRKCCIPIDIRGREIRH